MFPHFVAAFALLASADAQANFRGTGNMKVEEVSNAWKDELADKYHHVASFEDALRQMYTSLPKNTHGKLGHETTRYALRRYFMYRYGWFMSGLENGVSSSGWVPDFVLTALEGRVGEQGVDLHGLAMLTAALEDLTEKTSRQRLMSACNATFPDSPCETFSRTEAALVLETYIMMSMAPSTWQLDDVQDLDKKKEFFHEHVHDQFKSILEWFEPIRARHVGNITEGTAASFDTLAKAAEELDKTFHVYFDGDCKAMKSALATAQGRKAGRVRLAAFYNMSLYEDWDFKEKEEYLRAVGALDDSNPPSVIIANYALGRLNCLNETSLYASCCRNTCEDLMAHLEDKIRAPTATPTYIAQLVSNLPSETVKAPRELPATLLARLGEVADLHGGHVPLHGRLFAQWMHHAFPLECPYPHEAGTTNSQTPEEWMAETGQATLEKSIEEMRKQVEADTCSVNWEGKVDCGEESDDLPWSLTEELLNNSPESKHSSHPVFALLCLISSLFVAWPLVRSGIAAGFDFSFVRKSESHSHVAIAVLLLTASTYLMDLLDDAIFAVAVVSCLAVLGIRLSTKRLTGQQSCLPMQVKKV